MKRKSDGIIRYEENGLLKQMNDGDIVSMNTWGFTPQLFEFLARADNEMKTEYLLPELIDGMIAAGETTVHVLPTPEKWMGVTYAEDKPQVMAGIRELINAGIYPENLRA